MTILNISQETLIMLPDGATGGRVEITYNGVTVGPEIASGDDRGRAVLTSGRLAKLTALDGYTSLTVVGREAGGRVPARCTIRIYPEYPAGQTGPTSPITLTGLPVGHPDAAGIWTLSNIDDASGGLDVVTAGEREKLSVLMERNTVSVQSVEHTVLVAQQSISASEITARTAISNTETRASQALSTAIQTANSAADTLATGQQQIQSALENTQAMASQLADIPVLMSGVTASQTGDLWTLTPSNQSATITATPATNGGLLYDFTNLGGE